MRELRCLNSFQSILSGAHRSCVRSLHVRAAPNTQLTHHFCRKRSLAPLSWRLVLKKLKRLDGASFVNDDAALKSREQLVKCLEKRLRQSSWRIGKELLHVYVVCLQDKVKLETWTGVIEPALQRHGLELDEQLKYLLCISFVKSRELCGVRLLLANSPTLSVVESLLLGEDALRKSLLQNAPKVTAKNDWCIIFCALGTYSESLRPMKITLDAFARSQCPGGPIHFYPFLYLVSELLKRNLVLMAYTVFVWMRDTAAKPDQNTVHKKLLSKMHELMDRKRPDPANLLMVKAVVGHMKLCGLPVSLKLYGVLMDVAAKSRDVAYAEYLYNDLWNAGLRPDMPIITSFLQAYSRGAQYKLVMELFDHFVKVSMPFESATAAVVLDSTGYSGKIEDARRVWKYLTLPENLHLVNENVCNSYIEALCRNFALSEAQNVLYTQMDLRQTLPIDHRLPSILPLGAQVKQNVVLNPFAGFLSFKRFGLFDISARFHGEETNTSVCKSTTLRLHGVYPSIKTFQTLLSFLCKHDCKMDIKRLMTLIQQQFPSYTNHCCSLLAQHESNSKQKCYRASQRFYRMV